MTTKTLASMILGTLFTLSVGCAGDAPGGGAGVGGTGGGT